MWRLRNFRKKHKLTQTELADKVGVTLRTLQNWEKGKSSITLDNAVKIADTLKIQIQDLIEDEISELESLSNEIINPYSDTLVDNKLIQALDKIPKDQIIAYISYREEEFSKIIGYQKFIEEKTKDIVISELAEKLKNL